MYMIVFSCCADHVHLSCQCFPGSRVELDRCPHPALGHPLPEGEGLIFIDFHRQWSALSLRERVAEGRVRAMSLF